MDNVVVKAPTRAHTVVVDRVNQNGVKAGETWFNYGRTFKGERLTPEAIGLEVTMTLVQSKDGNEYVRSIDKIGPKAAAPAQEDLSSEAESGAEAEGACPPTAEEAKVPQKGTASPEALIYAEDLSRKWKYGAISSEDLEQLCQIAFKKAFSALAPEETSKLIEFFGGYKRSGTRS